MTYGSSRSVSSDRFLDVWLGAIPNSASEPSGLSAIPFFKLDPTPDVADSDDSLAWAAREFSTLLAKYEDQWILVKTHQVIANSPNPTELLSRAVELGIDRPLLLRVEASTAPRRTAFAIW
jgi:hypothetical protein